MAVDISDLPVPTKDVDISDLPAPKETPGFAEKTKAGFKSLLESTPGAVGAVTGAELGATAGSALGPIGSAIGGLAGGIGGYAYGEYAGKKAGKAIPQSVKEATGFTPEQRAKERKEMPLVSQVYGAAPDIAAIAPSAYSLGKFGISKAGELADFIRSAKAPVPIADIKDLATVGEKGYKVLTDKASKLYDARKAQADTLYDKAFDEARKAQAKGVPFATSNEGRALLSDLEKEKTVVAGQQKFEKGQDKIAGINRLIDAIKGTTTGGQKVPVGKGLLSGKITKTTPTKTTEKDVDAIVEELRFLRDVDARGKTYEAYAALDANYKRALAKRLESALHAWNDDYRIADEAYKAASRKLDPFKTQLMSNALKGEKFNAKDLIASPEDFGRTFFSDVDGVRQLKTVTQDPQQVSQLAKEYTASILANKSPAEMRSWAFDTRNTGWLNEAGILQPVQEYASKAETAASRKLILERLGYAAAAGAAGGVIASPILYGVRRSLGL